MTSPGLERWSGLIAALLLVALTLPWLGAAHWSGEEGKRALVARTMVETGEYLLPSLDDRPYVAKPPLVNWQIAATTTLVGELTPFAARLGSLLLLALLCVVLVAILARELPGWPLWILAAGLALQRTLLDYAQLAEIDMQFSVLVSLALWSWYALFRDAARGLRLWALPVAFAALAFLSKGPPGPLFLILGTAAFLLLERRFRDHGGGWLGATAALLAVAAAWAAFLWTQVPVDLMDQELRGELAERFSEFPWWQRLLQPITLPVQFLAVALPLTLWLLPLLGRDERSRLAPEQRRLARFAAAVIAVNLPIYVIPDLNLRYVLPLTPTLLVLCVVGLEALRRGPERRWVRVAALTTVGLAVIFALLPLVNLALGRPHLLPAALVAPLALALAAAALVTGLRARGRAAVAAGIASVLFLAALHLGDLDLRRQYEVDRDRERRPTAAILDAIAGHTGHGERSVAVVGWLPEEFYLADRDHLLGPRRTEPPSLPWAITLVEGTDPLPDWSAAGTIVESWRYRKSGRLLLVRLGQGAPVDVASP